MKETLIASLRLLAASGLALPGCLAAQQVELDLRSVNIDHDPVPWIAETGEQIPSGFALAARLALDNWLFLEAEMSAGSELRTGAICGGFIQDPERECISEAVEYTGGLQALSIGWPGRLGIGRSFVVGLRPRIGIGRVRAREAGRETGRRYYESPYARIVGVAAEVSYSLPLHGLRFQVSAGRDRISPEIEDCLDCRQLFWKDLQQTWYSFGIAWDWRSRTGG